MKFFLFLKIEFSKKKLQIWSNLRIKKNTFLPLIMNFFFRVAVSFTWSSSWCTVWVSRWCWGCALLVEACYLDWWDGVFQMDSYNTCSCCWWSTILTYWSKTDELIIKTSIIDCYFQLPDGTPYWLLGADNDCAWLSSRNKIWRTCSNNCGSTLAPSFDWKPPLLPPNELPPKLLPPKLLPPKPPDDGRL